MGQLATKALVAIDGSERAASLIEYVAGQFEPHKVELTLFNVHDQLPESFRDIDKDLGYLFRLGEVQNWDTARRAAMDKFMDKATARLVEAGWDPEDIHCVVAERSHGIARDLIAEAGRGYDLVVIGRRGLGAVKSLVLGSVASKLITALRGRPLWVVGLGAAPGRLLMAVDSSQCSLLSAGHLAATIDNNAVITAFHAVRSAQRAAYYDAELSGLLPPFSEELFMARVQRILQESERMLVEAGFNQARVGTKLAGGVVSRAQAIVETARAGDYGTIVMGRRGLSDISDFALGRVSANVLHMAKGLAVCLLD